MFTEHLNEKLPRSPLFPPRAALANSSKELFCSVAGGKRKHCCLHTLPVSVGRITFTFLSNFTISLDRTPTYQSNVKTVMLRNRNSETDTDLKAVPVL